MDIGWSELARYLAGAFALYLVLEGILPFFNPGAAQRLIWKRRQGRVRVSNTESEHDRSRKARCSVLRVRFTATADAKGPK